MEKLSSLFSFMHTHALQVILGSLVFVIDIRIFSFSFDTWQDIEPNGSSKPNLKDILKMMGFYLIFLATTGFGLWLVKIPFRSVLIIVCGIVSPGWLLYVLRHYLSENKKRITNPKENKPALRGVSWLLLCVILLSIGYLWNLKNNILFGNAILIISLFLFYRFFLDPFLRNSGAKILWALPGGVLAGAAVILGWLVQGIPYSQIVYLFCGIVIPLSTTAAIWARMRYVDENELKKTKWIRLRQVSNIFLFVAILAVIGMIIFNHPFHFRIRLLFFILGSWISSIVLGNIKGKIWKWLSYLTLFFACLGFYVFIGSFIHIPEINLKEIPWIWVLITTTLGIVGGCLGILVSLFLFYWFTEHLEMKRVEFQRSLDEIDPRYEWRSYSGSRMGPASRRDVLTHGSTKQSIPALQPKGIGRFFSILLGICFWLASFMLPIFWLNHLKVPKILLIIIAVFININVIQLFFIYIQKKE